MRPKGLKVSSVYSVDTFSDMWTIATSHLLVSDHLKEAVQNIFGNLVCLYIESCLNSFIEISCLYISMSMISKNFNYKPYI